MAVILRPATGADLAQIEELLRENGLPGDGVAEHLKGFSVADDQGRIVASAGIERYGSAALLRSVAVHLEYWERGLARMLVTDLLEWAARERIGEVFLLTTSAAGYFRRFGFTPIEQDQVPASVQASKEFGDCCCAGAQAMRRAGTEQEQHGRRVLDQGGPR